jgi:hypothetical protein
VDSIRTTTASRMPALVALYGGALAFGSREVPAPVRSGSGIHRGPDPPGE